MTNNQNFLNDCYEILISELMTDEELRDAFLRDPESTLRTADDWGVPLCDSELQQLRTPARWQRLAEQLAGRLAAAA
jgi:hypothetical protein